MEWIKCIDRMPSEYENVLIGNKMETPIVAFMSISEHDEQEIYTWFEQTKGKEGHVSGMCFSIDDLAESGGFTHWFPIELID